MSDFEKEIYTPLGEAKEEIWKRWNDVSLRKEVAAFVGSVPAVLKDEPRAVLFRNIMTPNNEFLHFLNESRLTCLKPLGLEFVADRFCTRNADKISLGRLSFLNKTNGNGGAAFHYRRIIDMTGCDGSVFCDIQTKWGEDLIAFHHRILSDIHSGIEYFDGSSWYKSNGRNASTYYQKFLSLFICHGVLFENFVTNAEEQRFADEVVYPAFKIIREILGVKPLIVSLLPHDNASDKYWWCYPEHVEKEVEKCLKIHSRG